MATKGISYAKVQRNSKGFTAVLSSTVCEWLLILMLFIDATLSYLLTKFSHYCKLQPPCPLCSRLDHVLGNEEPQFYHNLVCGNHRLEISSLISCQIHDKLADFHRICEECLFSSTIKKSKSETDRLLVGKLGLDLDSNGKECSTHHSEVDLLALENEASDLNNRMKVLKADYHFLVHIVNSMQNGNEGLEFVQEIAHQLGEI